ncbi:hypothetical protein R5R35_013894 [Gryllus longicercus]|uniref:Uncharacterized protein n=1 Tax=Gryllus longicercus TaxID=2509291 RepID=A0AAN9VND4_9ORTH
MGPRRAPAGPRRRSRPLPTLRGIDFDPQRPPRAVGVWWWWWCWCVEWLGACGACEVVVVVVSVPVVVVAVSVKRNGSHVGGSPVAGCLRLLRPPPCGLNDER